MGIFDFFKGLVHKEVEPERPKIVSERSPIKVKIIVNTVNVRRGPGTNYSIGGVLVLDDVQTITELSGKWGRLKSGTGWIDCSDENVEVIS